MARYFVTGGCGFIGSHLVDRLIELKHEVIVLDNLSSGKRENLSPAAKLIVGDIADKQLLAEILPEVDGCFHLAAIVSVPLSQEDWLGTHEVNLSGTINIFETASRLYKKNRKVVPIVYASSCAVYGDSDQLPLSEAVPAKPISAYGADKLGCELHGRIATEIHHIPTIGLRLFNVYGPRQDPKSPYSGVISIFADHARQHKPVTIFGDGEQTRDFIYVADVVAHFIFFMQHIKYAPNVFNVCTGNMRTINDLANELGSLLNYSIEKLYEPKRPGDVLLSCGNPSKANECGIDAKISLGSGLKKLLEG